MTEHDELCHYQKLEQIDSELGEAEEEVVEEVPISLNTMGGMGGVGIMQLVGESAGHTLNILVDS